MYNMYAVDISALESSVHGLGHPCFVEDLGPELDGYKYKKIIKIAAHAGTLTSMTTFSCQAKSVQKPTFINR